MRSDDLSGTCCDEVRKSLLAERTLTAAELAHAETCEACADALMETEIEAALITKPEIAIPEDFAARIATHAKSENRARRWMLQKLSHGRLRRHIGRNVAVALLLVMMTVLSMIDPRWLTGTGTVPMTLLLVLAGEMAGIALWLGLRQEA